MQKTIKISALFILSVCLSFQILKPVKWSSTSSKKGAKVGETVDLIFQGKIDKGWYLYSSELKVDGPMATEVQITPNSGFQLVGKLTAIAPKEKYDDVWGGKIAYFTKDAKFVQKVKVLKVNATVEGKIICQTCTEKDGKCVPNKDKFSISL